jgi:hypothetical protein
MKLRLTMKMKKIVAKKKEKIIIKLKMGIQKIQKK